jgi:DNA-binding CsgD family transcriptional regulator
MVVREAIYNAVRHGRPSRVRLEIAFAKNSCRVRILDDGTGFEPGDLSSSPLGHYGLVGMKERVQRIGGKLVLSSRSGAGTEVKFHVPRRAATSADESDIHRALEAGAKGYVIKGMPYQTLIDSLLRVHSGGRFLPPPVARALASRLPDSDLSSREQEVLRRLVDGLTNKEIANLLGITEATVKCHVSTILMRLNVSDRTQAVVTALQRGLVHL